MVDSDSQAGLIRTVGPSGFFTLAFGAIIGSGWIVVLGDWLTAAGPLGSVLGFVAGCLVMLLVATCYGELASRSSMAGGEFLYTLHSFGRFPAFLVGWFLAFYSITVCAFEGIALAWLLRTLLPAISLPTAYSLAGEAITWDALTIGIAAALVIALLHYRGARSAIRFQNIVTYGFIAASIVVIICGFSLGSISNLSPLLSARPGHHWTTGFLWTFSTCAFFLNGWQTSLHAIEERRENLSVATAVRAMLLAIAAAAAFYAAIIVASAMSAPWPTIIGKELPAAAAFRAVGGSALGTLVLVAATVSLTKSWSACAWIATRLVFAEARHNMLPARFAQVDPKSGAPRNAIIFVTVLSILGTAMGRGAVTPIVNMLSLCSALSILLCLVVLLRQRRTEVNRPPFSVPGGLAFVWLALAGALFMVGIAVTEPLRNGTTGVPLEWLLLLGWGAIGVAVWFSTHRAK